MCVYSVCSYNDCIHHITVSLSCPHFTAMGSSSSADESAARLVRRKLFSQSDERNESIVNISSSSSSSTHSIDTIEEMDSSSSSSRGCVSVTDIPDAHSHTTHTSHTTRNVLQMMKDLCSSLTFWRFVGFTLLLINLKAVFRHLDATFPTYLVRCFGSDVPKGTIYSINPFMIMFLTPLVAALTSQYAHYDMIKYGGYLTAVSPFFLAVSSSVWASVCMIVVLSLGEAIWSPRTYDYTMSIAPEVGR